MEFRLQAAPSHLADVTVTVIAVGEIVDVDLQFLISDSATFRAIGAAELLVDQRLTVTLNDLSAPAGLLIAVEAIEETGTNGIGCGFGDTSGAGSLVITLIPPCVLGESARFRLVQAPELELEGLVRGPGVADTTPLWFTGMRGVQFVAIGASSVLAPRFDGVLELAGAGIPEISISAFRTEDGRLDRGLTLETDLTETAPTLTRDLGILAVTSMRTEVPGTVMLNGYPAPQGFWLAFSSSLLRKSAPALKWERMVHSRSMCSKATSAPLGLQFNSSFSPTNPRT